MPGRLDESGAAKTKCGSTIDIRRSSATCYAPGQENGKVRIKKYVSPRLAPTHGKGCFPSLQSVRFNVFLLRTLLNPSQFSLTPYLEFSTLQLRQKLSVGRLIF